MKNIVFVIFTIALFVQTACNIINPAEPIPFYIQVDSVTTTTDVATQGTNSNNITDLWIDVNTDRLGVFPLPVLAPVLSTGTSDVTLSAGIMDNGVSGTRTTYPFYQPYTFTLTGEPKSIYKYKPNFTYRAATKFPLIEDFEVGNVVMEVPLAMNAEKVLYLFDDFISSDHMPVASSKHHHHIWLLLQSVLPLLKRL